MYFIPLTLENFVDIAQKDFKFLDGDTDRRMDGQHVSNLASP